MAEEVFNFTDPDAPIADNLLKIFVYFSSLQDFKITEEPIYDSVQTKCIVLEGARS